MSSITEQVYRALVQQDMDSGSLKFETKSSSRTFTICAVDSTMHLWCSIGTIPIPLKERKNSIIVSIFKGTTIIFLKQINKKECV